MRGTALTAKQTTDSGTASLEAALAHARAQVGASATAGATVPATGAVDLPAGVDPESVLWDEVLNAGGYAVAVLRRGSLVRFVDLDGGTCANLQLWNATLPSERLNPADTVKVQWQAYLGVGSLLLSDRGRALATVTKDTSAGHDALCGHTNRRGNELRYGHGGAHSSSPATRDLLALAAARHGLERRDLTSGFNLFSPVRVGDDGSLALAPASGTEAHIEVRTELDVIVAVAVGPHPLDRRPDYSAGRIRITAWTPGTSEPASSADLTPERRRALENTDQFLSGARR